MFADRLMRPNTKHPRRQMDIFGFVQDRTVKYGGILLSDLKAWCKENGICRYLLKIRLLIDKGLLCLEEDTNIVRTTLKARPDNTID